MSSPGKSEAYDMLVAQAHLWNHTFNFINSMSLKCAIQLGIPDIIFKNGGTMALADLLSALSVSSEKAPCVDRLMRILTHSGFFVEEKINEKEFEEKAYTLTSASRLLLKKEPFSVSPFLISMLDSILIMPWHHLSEWLQNEDPTPFNTAHGMTLWEYANCIPGFNHSFNEGMASDARLAGSLIVKNCRHVFQGLNSLVDVGGGTGTLAKAIAEEFPQLNCSVLDLPQVVGGLEGIKTFSYVEGNMFEFIPRTDAVLLKWILHDWNDEECVKILKNCKDAISSKDKRGKVIIIDMVVGYQKEDAMSIETQLFFDMLMMVLSRGKERCEKEWAKLFLDAGFSTYKITPALGLRSLIEVYP